MREGITVEGRDLYLSYKNFTLDVPSFTLEAGTTTALLGPSGSGKSTLLAVMGMLEKPQRGQILFNGHPVDKKEARDKMTAVFQRPFLMKGTVANNVAYGLKLRHVPRAEAFKRVCRTLETVGLGGFEKRSITELSGGEAQRVALARALVLDPAVLLLDEPLGSLDALLKRHLSLEFSHILHDLNITALYVTHDYDEALVVADKVSVIREGRIVSRDTSRSVETSILDSWLSEFLEIGTPLYGTVTAVADGLARIDVAGNEILAKEKDYAPGDRLAVLVSPEDIIIFAADEPIGRLSAQNVFEMRVKSIETRGKLYHLVLEREGLCVEATISHLALLDLALKEGSVAFAAFKASAVQTVRV